MKKIISLLLTVLTVASAFLLPSCSKTDSEYIKGNKKLIIGITLYQPMNYYDPDNSEKLIGFDTEFAEAVCDKLGVEPVFQEINWETKEATLKAKNIDCIWNGLTVTEKRRDNMGFTTSYLINKQVVVIDKKNADKYTDAASLSGAILTAEKESAGQTAIEADSNLKKATFVASDVQSAALVSLASGNVDAAVIDYTMAMASVGHDSYENLVIVDSIKLADEEYAVGFRLDSDMIDEVNKIIADLYKDGTLTKIAEKYNLEERLKEAFEK